MNSSHSARPAAQVTAQDTGRSPASVGELADRLGPLTLRDRTRLGRRLENARGIRSAEKRDRTLAGIERAVGDAENRLHARQRTHARLSTTLHYPDELPVSQRRDDIAAAIRDHQVVVVAGETGSGKTTQIPKICLELGRGVQGQIGHTQPRRIAARSVAERVAEETRTDLGDAIGYTVRFTDKATDSTLVRLMTDGILLAQITDDPDLLRYDTIVIDEAHERSLTIDFLLGYLRDLLPRRPDLKVVITSATIDPERFAAHFGGAPIIEVSGRTYPVEVRYRPLVDPDAEPGKAGATADPERDQVQAVLDAVDELCTEGPGDILVFFSGEREIRDAADALRPHLARRREHTEVLPLYARLSAAEQHRVFERHQGRRVVLATNVAETSLTVPGIRYVIDPGTARISRYSLRTKVQRLPIEAVSQASARQRAGRCGRVAAGVCIRLYSEDDFDARPEFTDPEIVRTNLASVILQMTALGLGDIAAFPFVDPPDRRQITDGVALLHELGAIDPDATDPRRRLTDIGRRLSQLPVDPRLARMVLEADRNGCAREVIVLAAALSVQDPRERPTEKQEAARQQHARFADEHSDFAAYLGLWRYLKDLQGELSGNQFRKRVRSEYLNYLRIREWQDLETQLRQAARAVGVTLNDTAADAARIHTSVLAGLLSHIGLRDERRRDYQGARGARFHVFPGSTLARRQPTWVMAAELVETSRLYGRTLARIDPSWIEPLAGHLVKRTYAEPRWSKKRAGAVADERVTLYGVPVVAGRAVPYGGVDPEVARELFLRHALVEGDWNGRHRFLQANQELLADAEDLEHRARRRDIVVDDDTLFAFYDARVPAEVVSGAHFDSWWKRARRQDPDLLTFTREMLLRDTADSVDAGQFPDHWVVTTVAGTLELDLTYQFDPGADTDGVTVAVPVEVLNQLPADAFDWQVPGLRADLVVAWLRSLPKPLRRQLVPAPDVAAEVLRRVGPGDGPLLRTLEDTLYTMRRVDVTREDWQPGTVPDHLRITVRVLAEDGGTLAEGTDLAALQRRFAADTMAAITGAVDAAAPAPAPRQPAPLPVSGLERDDLRTWDVGTLPTTYTAVVGSYPVEAYPALVEAADGTVGVRLTPTPEAQERAHRVGLRRLLQLDLPDPTSPVQRALPPPTALALARSPHGSLRALVQDATLAAIDHLIRTGGGVVWDEAGYRRLRDHVRADLVDLTTDVVGSVGRVLERARAVESGLTGTSSLTLLPALADLRTQLGELVYPGFITATGRSRLNDVARYLRAMSRRLEKLPTAGPRDHDRMGTVQRLRAEYDAVLTTLDPARRDDEDVREVRWMLEELRVSLFAQDLGTKGSVSEQRIHRALDTLDVS